jgi:peptidoglycan/LPS O-acetylase OafA/YrhL
MRRTLRIFPLYYGVLLLLMLVIPGAWLAWFDPQLSEMRALQGWMWPYLTNIYLAPRETFAIPYVSHFWTLAIEEHFYLVWPLLIWLLSRKAAMRACVLLGAAALVLRISFSAWYPNALYAQVLTPCRLDTLCAGAWFALAVRGQEAPALNRAERWAVISGIAVLAVSFWHLTTHRWATLTLPVRGTLLALFFACSIYVASRQDAPHVLKRGLQMRWLRALGKYSYGLYVFHGIVAYALDRHPIEHALAALLGSRLLGAMLQILVATGLSVLLSIASYELYESRFLKLKKWFSPHADAVTSRERAPVAELAQRGVP